MVRACFVGVCVGALLGCGTVEPCGAITFAPRVDYPTGAGPDGDYPVIAVADLNGDGAADLVVSNLLGGTVTVRLGHGDGTFAAKTDVATVGLPGTVVAADLNGDGKLDLAFSAQGGGDGTVHVLLGHGDGTFAAGVDYPALLAAGDLVAADLNGDGLPDLAVATATGQVDPMVVDTTPALSVLLNQGDGTFGPGVVYSIEVSPFAIVAADLNGDGQIDLAVLDSACASESRLGVMINQGLGTFAPGVSYHVSDCSMSFAAADLNGDGWPDLAVTTRDIGGLPGTNTPDPPAMVKVLLNQGDGTFAAGSSFPARNDAYAIAARDLNGDGRPDLAVAGGFADNDVAVFVNQGGGTFAWSADLPTGARPGFVVAADLDGDGRADLVTGNQADGTASVLLNTCAH